MEFFGCCLELFEEQGSCFCCERCGIVYADYMRNGGGGAWISGSFELRLSSEWVVLEVTVYRSLCVGPVERAGICIMGSDFEKGFKFCLRRSISIYRSVMRSVSVLFAILIFSRIHN